MTGTGTKAIDAATDGAEWQTPAVFDAVRSRSQVTIVVPITDISAQLAVPVQAVICVVSHPLSMKNDDY